MGIFLGTRCVEKVFFFLGRGWVKFSKKGVAFSYKYTVEGASGSRDFCLFSSPTSSSSILLRTHFIPRCVCV